MGGRPLPYDPRPRAAFDWGRAERTSISAGRPIVPLVDVALFNFNRVAVSVLAHTGELHGLAPRDRRLDAVAALQHRDVVQTEFIGELLRGHPLAKLRSNNTMVQMP